MRGGRWRLRAVARSLGSARKELGYHGFIALFVLVERRHVTSMAWQELTVAHSTVRRGKVLGIRALTAANKGAVGTACRFGTTIAFVGAHLNSDKRGVSSSRSASATRATCAGNRARVRRPRLWPRGLRPPRDPPRRSQLPRRAAARHGARADGPRPLGVAPRRRRALDGDGAATRPQRLARGADRLPPHLPPPPRRRAAARRRRRRDGTAATSSARRRVVAAYPTRARRWRRSRLRTRCTSTGRSVPVVHRPRAPPLPAGARASANVRRLRRVRIADGVGPPPRRRRPCTLRARSRRRGAAPTQRARRGVTLVVRGGGSLRCQLRLSELTLHDDDAAERLALFPMSSVADGASSPR